MAKRRDRSANVRRFLPLRPNVCGILTVLAEGDVHGYGIKKEVERRSGGTVRLEAGTLYRLIARLLSDGLIMETPGAPTDERRRDYRLTGLGRQVLVAEMDRLAAIVDRARALELIGARKP